MSRISLGAEDWRAQALCADTNLEIWFSAGARQHKTAKKICRDCPVRRQCLSYAMDVPIDHGIWGGFTERERRRFRHMAGSGGWRAVVFGRQQVAS